MRILHALKAFGTFWYDFIIGDDPLVAVGVVVALGATAALAHSGTTAWWVLPAAVALLLVVTLARAAKPRSRPRTPPEPSTTPPASPR